MPEEKNRTENFFQTGLLQYNSVLQYEQQKVEKVNVLKERIAQFSTVSTLKDAKELAKKILPTAKEVSRFYVGDAMCVVVNRSGMLRISIDTAYEFICYDFFEAE